MKLTASKLYYYRVISHTESVAAYRVCRLHDEVHTVGKFRFAATKTRTFKVWAIMNTELQIIENRDSPVWQALQMVPDPEIPTVSIVELGMVNEVAASEDMRFISVNITPTFSGCPAINHIKEQVSEKLHALWPDAATSVNVDYTRQWSSNDITDEGRRKLKEFGLTPPKRYEGGFDVEEIAEAACPFCGSENTTMHSSFGPTLCRSVHYCFSCLQGFEQFKPL